MGDRTETLIRFYSKFHGRVPSVGEALLRQPLLFWFANLAVLVVILVYHFTLGGRSSLFLVGLAVGALSRDVGWMLRFKQDWPILDSMLDWPAIRAKIAKIH